MYNLCSENKGAKLPLSFSHMQSAGFLMMQLISGMIIDAFAANFRGDMVQCYHHACDNVTNLLTDENIKFLGKTADAITATLNKLSETSGGKQILG